MGLSSTEIEYLFMISSWYASGPIQKYTNQSNVPDKDESNLEKNELNTLSSGQRTVLGKYSKRITDLGRVLFLLEKGYKCELIKYCDS